MTKPAKRKPNQNPPLLPRSPLPHQSKRAIPAYRNAFLAELRGGRSPSMAAKVAGIDRSTAYLWRRTDEEFRKQWADAVEEGIDLLEDEAKRRGIEGVLKPVYYMGEVVGEVREYSDALLALLLKGLRASVYAPNNRVELTGADGRPIEIQALTEEQAAKRLLELGVKPAIFDPDEDEDQ
jgi:hypothetical protein